MFKFQGDWFNAQYVVAMTREDAVVYVYAHDAEEPWEYTFDDEDHAREELDKAARDWATALQLTPQ